MTRFKLVTAALLTAAVVASPAMARRHHTVSQPSPDEAYAIPAQGNLSEGYYGNHRNGVRCVSAPRVGQFASDQWDNDIPCEPGTLAY